MQFGVESNKLCQDCFGNVTIYGKGWICSKCGKRWWLPKCFLPLVSEGGKCLGCACDGDDEPIEKCKKCKYNNTYGIE